MISQLACSCCDVVVGVVVVVVAVAAAAAAVAVVWLLIFQAQTTGPTESTATAFNTDIILNQGTHNYHFHELY